MRALLFGLVGAVLVAGCAEAKTCRLDRLELISVAKGPGADPAMTGQRFRVVHQTSRFDAPTSGSIVVEVSSKAGSFIIDQQYVPHSLPWASAGSKRVSPNDRIDWSKRDRRREAQVFEGDGAFDVYSGPLNGLILHPTNCVEAHAKSP